MKVRVKFSKYGPARFMGHLDVMRYFQKAVRRAEIPIGFSTGFRPHMIMSFAAPLGLGITSDGEYFDMELVREMPSEEIVRRFNEAMAEGFRVTCAKKTSEGKKHNAMAVTAACGYRVRFCKEDETEFCHLAGQMESFCAQADILVEKESKNGHKTADIRPGIYRFQAVSKEWDMLLAASSANYVKPQMVMDAFAGYLGTHFPPHSYAVHKTEVYANTGTEKSPSFVPLEELGEDIE